MIIDSGASDFIPFNNYLLNNEVFSMLKEMGHEVYIHYVIVGGEGCTDTVSSLKQLAQNYKTTGVKIITWLNPFLGDIEQNGKRFSDFAVYNDNTDIITAYIDLPKFKSEWGCGHNPGHQTR